MEVVFLLAAQQDLQLAYNWVAERRHGKEQPFLHDVESRLEQLKRFPLSGRLYRTDLITSKLSPFMDSLLLKPSNF
jgi:plasmid stabilization system protein ParE